MSERTSPSGSHLCVGGTRYVLDLHWKAAVDLNTYCFFLVDKHGNSPMLRARVFMSRSTHFIVRPSNSYGPLRSLGCHLKTDAHNWIVRASIQHAAVDFLYGTQSSTQWFLLYKLLCKLHSSSFHANAFVMRSSSYTEQQFVKTTRGSRRELAIDSFSQIQGSSVWYYRVNVSVFEQVLVSTFIDEDSSDDDDGRCSGDSQGATYIEHYSILRRYRDFLQLYSQICGELGSDSKTLPSFPGKELISPALKGMLRREYSTTSVLEHRSAKFEALLQWIEKHPFARNSAAFVKFIGKPPQSRDGYVSLKEYTPSDWLSSLQQTANGVESRRRRASTAGRFERSGLENDRQLPLPVVKYYSAKEMSFMSGGGRCFGIK